MVKNPLAVQEIQEAQVWFLGWEDSLEKEMATYFCIVAWKIPWTEGPGGPQSMGSQRVGHDWATEHAGHWPLGHEVHKFLQTLPNSLDTKSPLTENHRFMKLYINIKFTRTAKQSTTVGWLNRCLLCHSSGGEKCEVHMWAGLHSSGSWERMCPRSLP